MKQEERITETLRTVEPGVHGFLLVEVVAFTSTTRASPGT